MSDGKIGISVMDYSLIRNKRRSCLQPWVLPCQEAVCLIKLFAILFCIKRMTFLKSTKRCWSSVKKILGSG